MFIFPLQDFFFFFAPCVSECPAVCVWMCTFTSVSVCASVCGLTRWTAGPYTAPLLVGGVEWTEGATAGDRRGVEALCVPQANRPDKIRVEGAQLEAFLSWPLTPPLSHSSKPLRCPLSPCSLYPPTPPPILPLNNSFLLQLIFSLPTSHSACLSTHYSLFFKQYPHVWSFLRSFFSSCVMSSLLFLTLLPLLSLPFPPPLPLRRTSVKWGQPLACNAMSFLCFSFALWPCSLILASLNWPIAFHVFPWVMS